MRELETQVWEDFDGSSQVVHTAAVGDGYCLVLFTEVVDQGHCGLSDGWLPIAKLQVQKTDMDVRKGDRPEYLYRYGSELEPARNKAKVVALNNMRDMMETAVREYPDSRAVRRLAGKVLK